MPQCFLAIEVNVLELLHDLHNTITVHTDQEGFLATMPSGDDEGLRNGDL